MNQQQESILNQMIEAIEISLDRGKKKRTPTYKDLEKSVHTLQNENEMLCNLVAGLTDQNAILNNMLDYCKRLPDYNDHECRKFNANKRNPAH